MMIDEIAPVSDFDKRRIEDRVKQIYLDYNQKIVPLIAILETETDKYPIEILNEIRAIFSHLGDYAIDGDEKSVDNAESHMKRAILDCYKYVCIAYQEEISLNDESCRNVDLTAVADGSFLCEYVKQKESARASFVKAKISEKDNILSAEDIYRMYEEAYCSYYEVMKIWRTHGVAIEYAKNRFQKQEEERQRDRFIAKVSVVVTVASILVTIISIVH